MGLTPSELDDPAAIRAAARDVEQVFVGVMQRAEDIAAVWGGLVISYDAPDDGVVHAAMEKPHGYACTVRDHAAAMKAALDSYADRLAELARVREQLVADIAAHEGSSHPVMDKCEPVVGKWGKSGEEADLAKVLEADELARRVEVFETDLENAQRDCGNALNGTWGGPRFMPIDQTHVHYEYGYGTSADTKRAQTRTGQASWGAPEAWKYATSWGSGYLLFSGVADSFAELGDMAWTLSGVGGDDGATEYLRSTMWHAGLQTGHDLLATGFVGSAYLHATGRSHQVVESGQRLVELGKGMLSWDTWGTDPLRTGGGFLPDAISVIAGGVGAGKIGARAMVKGLEPGAAARVSGLIDVFDRSRGNDAIALADLSHRGVNSLDVSELDFVADSADSVAPVVPVPRHAADDSTDQLADPVTPLQPSVGAGSSNEADTPTQTAQTGRPAVTQTDEPTAPAAGSTEADQPVAGPMDPADPPAAAAGINGPVEVIDQPDTSRDVAGDPGDPADAAAGSSAPDAPGDLAAPAVPADLVKEPELLDADLEPPTEGTRVSPASDAKPYKPESKPITTVSVQEAPKRYTPADVQDTLDRAPRNEYGQPVDHRNGRPLLLTDQHGHRGWHMRWDPENQQFIAENRSLKESGLPLKGPENGFGYDSKGNLLPYANSRPSFPQKLIELVWNRSRSKQLEEIAAGELDLPTPGPDEMWVRTTDGATGPDIVSVGDQSWRKISWQPGQPRQGVWDMGHLPKVQYKYLRHRYLSGKMDTDQFLQQYLDAKNYRVEDPLRNRSHVDEIKIEGE